MISRASLLMIVVSVIGCSSQAVPDQVSVTASLANPLPGSPQSTDKPALDEKESPRHIIREGQLRFETESRESTRTAIVSIAAARRGYFADDSEQRSSLMIEQSMVIRVPPEEFDGLLEEVSRGVRKFDVRRIQAVDVTEEYVDVASRLKTRKDTEERYRELLKQANTVEDILKIEGQIDKLRAEIESTEGRLRLLQDRESYSTLSVTFYETLAQSSIQAPAFLTRFISSLSIGWHAVVEATIVVAALWPFLVVAAIVAMVVRRRGRHSRQAIAT